jgi:hypothetical protein
MDRIKKFGTCVGGSKDSDFFFFLKKKFPFKMPITVQSQKANKHIKRASYNNSKWWVDQ